MSKQILATIPDMVECSTGMLKASKNIALLKNEVMSLVNSLSGSWQGTRAEALATQLKTQEPKLDTPIHMLAKTGVALLAFAKRIDDADQMRDQSDAYYEEEHQLGLDTMVYPYGYGESAVYVHETELRFFLRDNDQLALPSDEASTSMESISVQELEWLEQQAIARITYEFHATNPAFEFNRDDIPDLDGDGVNGSFMDLMEISFLLNIECNNTCPVPSPEPPDASAYDLNGDGSTRDEYPDSWMFTQPTYTPSSESSSNSSESTDISEYDLNGNGSTRDEYPDSWMSTQPAPQPTYTPSSGSSSDSSSTPYTNNSTHQETTAETNARGQGASTGYNTYY